MKSKISRKLALYFYAALLLFALVIGFIFIVLFREQIINENKNDLESRAVSIADALANYTGSGSGNDLTGSINKEKSGYGAYLRFIDDIAMADVWIIDQNKNLIANNQISGRSYNYADLPANADKLIDEVFAGETAFSEEFSSLLQTSTLTVGTPITVSGSITGVVLLHSPVDGIDEVIWHGIGILAVSIIIAYFISTILAVFLALSFTKPLNKMKNSALLLAGGDYETKTGVHQKDEIGELAEAIDILSDKLCQSRLESKKFDNMRHDFIANISHELKTPVTVIRGSLETLCDGVITDKEKVSEYYRQMLRESINLQRLINDLLDLSKLQNTDFKIEMQQLNIHDIVNDSIRSAGQLAVKKNIQINKEFDEQPYSITGDFGRLRQMFLIILDNAIKFSRDGGIIDVVINGGIVSIIDYGIGITEDELPRIFDKFYKVNSNDNNLGSGLGLAIAKQIADRHNIKINVISKEGKGTRFDIIF